MATIRKNEIGISRVQMLKVNVNCLRSIRPTTASPRAPASYTVSREQAISYFNTNPRMAVTLVLCNTMRAIKIEQIHSKIVLAGLDLEKGLLTEASGQNAKIEASKQ